METYNRGNIIFVSEKTGFNTEIFYLVVYETVDVRKEPKQGAFFKVY